MRENFLNELKLLNVTAWGGAGKSVLLALLDGHPEVSIVPIHDKVPFDLAESYHNQRVLGDFRPVKRDLVKGGYVNFQLMSIFGGFDVLLSSRSEDNLKIPVEFNYHEFEKDWLEGLMDLQVWNRKTITELIYKRYNLHIGAQDETSFTAFMGVADAKKTLDFVNEFESSKTIVIRREVEGILSTKLNRKLPFSRAIGLSAFRELVFLILESARIAKFDRDLMKISANNTDKVMLVDFSELVGSPKQTMTKVLDFLKLAQNQACSTPTFFGHLLQKGSVSYVGQENDTDLYSKFSGRSRLVKVSYKCAAFGHYLLGKLKG